MRSRCSGKQGSSLLGAHGPPCRCPSPLPSSFGNIIEAKNLGSNFKQFSCCFRISEPNMFGFQNRNHKILYSANSKLHDFRCLWIRKRVPSESTLPEPRPGCLSPQERNSPFHPCYDGNTDKSRFVPSLAVEIPQRSNSPSDPSWTPLSQESRPQGESNRANVGLKA
jgi:hypothetical protein